MKDKPFSTSFVLKTTTKHMRKAIDISIRKTFDRLKDFEGDQEKGAEVFETLAKLHGLRKMVDDFQLVNKKEFRGE